MLGLVLQWRESLGVEVVEVVVTVTELVCSWSL